MCFRLERLHETIYLMAFLQISTRRLRDIGSWDAGIEDWRAFNNLR
jgi:hypothetical protein